MLHVPLLAPARLVLTHAVLQVEHGVALLRVLLQLILGRRVDHRVAPLLRRGGIVVQAAHLSGCHALLRTVVVTLRALWYLDAASLAVTAEEGLCGWVDEVHASDIHEVVVEAGHQWIGDGHPAALAVGLHVVLLAADIQHHLASLWGLDAEVGATLLVHLRKFIAWYGGLCQNGIGRHLYLLGHLDVGAHGLEAQLTGHGLTVATAQLSIAGSIEVQTVRAVGAVVRRDDLGRVQRLGQLVNLFLTGDADTLAAGLYDVARIEGHLLGFQLQVAAEVVVHLFHHACPFGVASVRLALVHQDALDHTVLLGLLGQCHQSLVGVVVVGLEHTRHPAGSPFHVTLDAVGQETLDVDAADGHVDHAHLDMLWQRLHQCTAEPVGRGQSCVGTAQRRHCLAPLAHLATPLRVVNGRHQQEAWTRTHQVLGLRARCALHVRLSETQEDVEVRVYGSPRVCQGPCRQCHQHQAFHHCSHHNIKCSILNSQFLILNSQFSILNSQ